MLVEIAVSYLIIFINIFKKNNSIASKLAYNATCRMDQSCTSNYVCNSVSLQCACPANYIFPYLGIGQYATSCCRFHVLFIIIIILVNVLTNKGPIKYPTQACDGTVYTPCITNAFCNSSVLCACNIGYFFNTTALTCGLF